MQELLFWEEETMNENTQIKLFEDKKVRTVWDNITEEWYFSVVDVVEILTESPNPTAYWRKLKQRLRQEGNETVTNCHGLKMAAPDGKLRLTDVANTEQLFRLIQSIPSPKAEPFKLWMAQVAKERIDEVQDPELTINRALRAYKALGYSDSWINQRLKSIEIRKDLTDEWKKRGITEERDYAILTAEISKATFGMTPSEYKEFKGLTKKNQNLRDHMDDLELIFTMLGERVTTEISEKEEPDTFDKSKKIARRGGNVAGVARRETEKELGRKVSTPKNFLPDKDKPKLEDD